MQAPSYLLPQPLLHYTSDMLDAFERLYSDIVAAPFGQPIDYYLPQPRWQFLSFIGATKDVVLHGSCRPDLDIVEPKQAQDIRAFSAQRAIYATTDGIWAIFFAILDRQHYPMSLCNTCVQARLPSGQWSDPLYFFSITRSALAQRPWCRGAVYILPREHFAQEPSQQYNGVEVMFPHWMSEVSAKPLGRMIVGTEDFPYLAQIRGHDDEVIRRRASEDPAGFPWLDD